MNKCDSLFSKRIFVLSCPFIQILAHIWVQVCFVVECLTMGAMGLKLGTGNIVFLLPVKGRGVSVTTATSHLISDALNI